LRVRVLERRQYPEKKNTPGLSHVHLFYKENERRGMHRLRRVRGNLPGGCDQGGSRVSRCG